MKKPTVLVILDGYGIKEDERGNAVKLASTPNLDTLFEKYPNNILHASGLDVGLPEGQMGNSEVGHLNIGAGRIVYQEFTRISKSISDGDFYNNVALLKAIENVNSNNSSLHLCGLLSDGGVHSHNSHLYALLELAKRHEVKNVYIHCFLDGRDVPPSSAIKYIKELEDRIAEVGIGKIATLSGRYYAMDRDNRWERTKLAYDALTLGRGEYASSPVEAVEESYKRNESDEFVKPTVILEGGSPLATIKNKDSVIMFNFRPDRARQITRAFVDSKFTGFSREVFAKPYYVCMTQYDALMPDVTVAFPPQKLENTLGQYIADLGLNQLRIAETEKYAHVTFFFNGGVEEANKNEARILIPSPKVATYDMKPEMSAYEVTDRLIQELDKDLYDLIIVNYANCDMVGHTGSLESAINAVEAVDSCVGKLYDKILSKDGQMIITADHGNAEEMLDAQGNIVTAHTTNPVPIILVNAPREYSIAEGRLADIAPTILHLMGLPKPDEMTGDSLVLESVLATD